MQCFVVGHMSAVVTFPGSDSSGHYAVFLFFKSQCEWRSKLFKNNMKSTLNPDELFTNLKMPRG